MVWYGMVWYGMVWYGMVWYGMVWYGMVWYGMVWYGMVWYGMVWYGMVWYGMVWYGMVWYGMVWYCLPWSGLVYHRAFRWPTLTAAPAWGLFVQVKATGHALTCAKEVFKCVFGETIQGEDIQDKEDAQDVPDRTW